VKKHSANIILSVLASTTLGAVALGQDKALPPPVAAPEWAQPPAKKCAASFDDRLTETAQAIPAARKHHAEYRRVMPWFYANCRILTELERAVRKLDDENAFVCKPAKGRPKELTQQFVDDHLDDNTILDFQDHASEDMSCSGRDVAARGLSLDMRDVVAGLDEGATPEQSAIAGHHMMAIFCTVQTSDTSDQCVKLRAEIAAAASKDGK
jgi:hypothetical protein